MNEESKNIETCLAENILAEVASVPTDPQFRSLVNESLDPLKQQALQQAGYADYEKFAWPHKPYTFTSQVKQMKSNLILLLRRLWRFPFGRGTIRSLADMWQHYITRLQGSETYGIPSRLSQLTDLPSAPALLSDRKISGVPEAADGESLAKICCDDDRVAAITELTDDNIGWTFKNPALITRLCAMFTGLRKLTLNFQKVSGKVLASGTNLTELNMPGCEEIDIKMGYYDGAFYNPPFDIVLPKTKKITSSQYTYNAALVFCTTGNWAHNLKIEDLEELSQSSLAIIGDYGQGNVFADTKLFIGCRGTKSQIIILREMQGAGGQNTNMCADVEIGDFNNIAAGLSPRWKPCQSITFSNFNNLSAANLYNHILLRLKQDEPLCGSGVTITLGSTNIAKLEAVEEYNTKLTELEDTYGYTFA